MSDVSVADLISQLAEDSPSQRRAAAERLAQRGMAAQPATIALIDTLDPTDETLFEWCNAALEGLGPPPVTAVGPLLDRLQNASGTDGRFWCATLLGRLAASAAWSSDLAPADQTGIVAGLTSALHDAESTVQQAAIRALLHCGPSARPAVDSLADLATNSAEPRTRRLATQALTAIAKPTL